jgi:hypothetical protein
MGETLGIGVTHTGLTGDHVWLRDHFAEQRERRLSSPDTAPEFKDPGNWPEQMRRELGDDNGLSASQAYWTELVRGFREARKAIEAFNPDFVVIYGDDQYEAIHEDLMTPFTIFAINDQPLNRRQNLPGGAAQVPSIRGHVTAATHITHQLVRKNFDIAASWHLPHGETYPHAFYNTVDFLSFDGQGFPWPVVPVHVNCYGVDLRVPKDQFPQPNEDEGTMEGMRITPPPSPTPRRCYDLGKAIAQTIEDSPWRAVIIGSSSWSHASLTKKHYFLYPDIAADRSRKADLQSGNMTGWRDLDGDDLVRSGQHEFLNWVCLAGGMEGRKPEIIAYCEAHIFNSSRIIARIPA